jgi:hypothetical protein
MPAHKNAPSAGNARTRDGHKLVTLGVGDTLGEGDSSLVLHVLPPDLADVAFENMRREVAWNSMYHHGTRSIWFEIGDLTSPLSRRGGSTTCSCRRGSECRRQVKSLAEMKALSSCNIDVAVVCSFPIYRHPADESPPLLPFSRNCLSFENMFKQCSITR